MERFHTALSAIEARGLGISLLKALGEKFARRDGIEGDWKRGLDRTRDAHEKNEVSRAFAEWSDADSIAAHIGFGNDFLCSEDEGKNAGAPSVFATENRAWLSNNYGVKFVTISELACGLPAIPPRS